MRKKTKSIKQIFIYSMIFVTLFQSVIFIFTIVFGGVMGNLADVSYEPLLETTELRKTSLEEKLNSCSDILTSYNTAIKNELQKISIKYNQPVSALLTDTAKKNELFYVVSDEIKAVASTEGVTGGFIILDYNKDTATTAIDAFYLRNGSISGGNTLTVAIGNENLLSSLGLTKYSYWRSQLNCNEMDNIDFYTETLRLGEAYKDISTENLGYWSMPYDINYSEQDCVAYVIPLRDGAGVTYGVIGVEMNLTYLKSCLPYFELNSKGQGSYILGCLTDAENLQYRKIVASGESFDKVNQYSDTYELSGVSGSDEMFTISHKNSTLSKFYTTNNELEINPLAKYDKNIWYLNGIVEGKYLLSFVNYLRVKIILAFVIAAVISIAVVFLAAKLIARPINKFVEEVGKIRPDNLVTPKPIIVKEFNELGESIEQLTKDLSDFSAKASLIINMAGVPVGAFEYDKTSNVVFCTDITLDLLKIDNTDKKLFVSRREFEDKISVFMKFVQPNVDQVYRFVQGEESVWIHIKTAVNNGKILGTLRDVTAEKNAELKRIYVKEHDLMTDLYNRDTFNYRVKRRMINKRSATYAMMLINIDDMSYINKEYGTVGGDDVIKAVAQVLKSLDSKNTIIARTTGDEFCLFLVARNPIDVEKFVENMMLKFNECAVEINENLIDVKVSVGISLCPRDCDNFDTLLEYANFAMNVVKNNNKNGALFFSKEEYEMFKATQEGNKDMEDMIRSGNISYAYQPIIDTSNGEIYGYEALMRPNNADINLESMLDYAFKNGLNYEIERATWFNSLEGYTRQVNCLSPKKLFVNSMPSQLLSDSDFNEIELRFKEHLDNVVMEIVESEQVEDHILNKKRELKQKWNCLIALDDYGSGYSNDNTLLSVKPDLIKLDIELVKDIESDSDRQALVKNIVSYAHNRNIKVLAEGIENREQMYCLISIGVDLLQGFYLAKPDVEIAETIDAEIKNEILQYDPNDMFTANVSLYM